MDMYTDKTDNKMSSYMKLLKLSKNNTAAIPSKIKGFKN